MQRKKTAIITARMTPGIKDLIQHQAKQAGMTVTDYIITCALGKEIVHRQLTIEPGEPLKNELAAFVRSIQERGNHGCSGAEGLAALEAAHRILSEMETV